MSLHYRDYVRFLGVQMDVKDEYLFYNKASSLGLLLGYLLHLNSLGEFFAKGQMCLKEHDTIIHATQKLPKIKP